MGLKVKVETFRSRLGLLALSLARNSIDETHPTFSSQLSRLLPFSTPGAGSTSRLSRGAIGGIRLRAVLGDLRQRQVGQVFFLALFLRIESLPEATATSPPVAAAKQQQSAVDLGAPRLHKRTQKLWDDCFRIAKRNGDACMDFFDDRHGQRRKNTAHYTASRARISTTKMAMAMRSMAMSSGPNAPSRSHLSRARTVSSSARTLRTLNFAVAN